MLRIAIQKSGRLSEQSLDLLRKCDISIPNGISKLKALATNFAIEILYLRDDDIPQYVEDGVADIGIVGENVWFEKGCKGEILKRLDFGKCRLSIALPKNIPYSSLQDLEDKRIATSYPRILEEYLKEHKVRCDIQEISGSVEIAPSIGLADAICDIVSSGSTLFSNGLAEVETVFRSEAVLIAAEKLNSDKQTLLKKLLFRMEATQKAVKKKYILLNAPENQVNAMCKLLPGLKSPTLLPLKESGWVSIHSVIQTNDFWDILEQLKALGAEGILVTDIEKIID